MLSHYFIKNLFDISAASCSSDSEKVSLVAESASFSSQKIIAKKRTEKNGFTAENINERKKRMLAKAPYGNWRRFDEVSICYTVLI